jgi:tRNA modification GTPase
VVGSTGAETEAHRSAPFGLAKSGGLILTTDRFDASSSELLITRARHRGHLETAALHLEAFLLTRTSRLTSWQQLIVVNLDRNDVVAGAEELRYAAGEIGKIGGHVGVEDILDVVFSRFCIGK